MNEYTISTNTGLVHTNDEKLFANGLTIDDIIAGKLSEHCTVFMVIKNGKCLWPAHY